MAEWAANELELVRRCREGSEAAFAALVRLHRPRLFTLAYRLTGDATVAEDVVQETFLSAFRQIDRFEPKPSLAAWLNTICIRTAGKAAVDRKKRPASLEAPVRVGGSNGNGHADGMEAFGAGLEDVDPTVDPARAAEASELRRAVVEAIARLPFQQRVAVTLRHVMGMEYGDAADAMAVPLNTYKSHLLRGTRALRESLSAQLEAPVEPTRAVPVNGRGSAAEVGGAEAEPTASAAEAQMAVESAMRSDPA